MRRKYVNKWEKYEQLKKALPWMTPEEYDKAIRKICKQLGI